MSVGPAFGSSQGWAHLSVLFQTCSFPPCFKGRVTSVVPVNVWGGLWFLSCVGLVSLVPLAGPLPQAPPLSWSLCLLSSPRIGWAPSGRASHVASAPHSSPTIAWAPSCGPVPASTWPLCLPSSPRIGWAPSAGPTSHVACLPYSSRAALLGLLSLWGPGWAEICVHRL